MCQLSVARTDGVGHGRGGGSAVKLARRDGTSHLLFEPIEFMEKLAPEAAKASTFTVVRSVFLLDAARWDPGRHVTLVQSTSWK